MNETKYIALSKYSYLKLKRCLKKIIDLFDTMINIQAFTEMYL